MKILSTTLLIFLSLITDAQSVYDKVSVKAIIDRVNRYQLEKPWTEFDDNWIRGTYYSGVMSCYQATGDTKLLEQCNALGTKLNWQIPTLKPDQKASGVNLLTLGQTWLESYMVNKKKNKIKPIIYILQT